MEEEKRRAIKARYWSFILRYLLFIFYLVSKQHVINLLIFGVLYTDTSCKKIELRNVFMKRLHTCDATKKGWINTTRTSTVAVMLKKFLSFCLKFFQKIFVFELGKWEWDQIISVMNSSQSNLNFANVFSDYILQKKAIN